MIYLNCDYNEGAHPLILEKLVQTNMEQSIGYGKDEHCRHAADLIREACKEPNADVHFLVGGTQTNVTVIRSALRHYQGVICADTGHINVHETAAVEAAGHKCITIANQDGKITADQIEACVSAHKDEHMVQPKMVYISNTTELGTIYSKKELEEISAVCKQHGLYLFLDGARLGYALACKENELTLEDLAQLTDVFYIGGTKVGALFGEAVVITNEALKTDFRYNIKQNGGMLAKGRLLGIQFETLFTDHLYEKIAQNAADLAYEICERLTAAGVEFAIDSPSNQQFPIFNDQVWKKLQEKYVLEFQRRTEDGRNVVRICTSWASKKEDVEALILDIEKLVRA